MPRDYDGILVSLNLYRFHSETFDIKAQNLTHWLPGDPVKCTELKYKGHSESSASRKVSHTSSVTLKWNLLFMDPCIVDYSVEIPTRCSFV